MGSKRIQDNNLAEIFQDREMKHIFFELHHHLPREGPGRNKYTEKAYHMLPPIEKPKILDIGCGPGEPTILLAKLSKGTVIGMDIHQPYLDELERKAKKANLTSQVQILNQSLFEMDFPQESFDIIWSEGSIFLIGFEQGLREWHQYIKPHGFLVVHEMVWLQQDPPQEIKKYLEAAYPGIRQIPENLAIIPQCNYQVIGYFALPEDAWWIEYYHPLEKRIHKLKTKYHKNPKALKVLQLEQQEIDMYKKYSQWYGSTFFTMKKL
jgi:ubiquinone/menaquinone biosynthesis C-methylase UbiE